MDALLLMAQSLNFPTELVHSGMSLVEIRVKSRLRQAWLKDNSNAALPRRVEVDNRSGCAAVYLA